MKRKIFRSAAALASAVALGFWLWPETPTSPVAMEDVSAAPSKEGKALQNLVGTTASEQYATTVRRAPAHPIPPHKAMVADPASDSEGLLPFILHSDLSLAYRTELIQYLPEVISPEMAAEITSFLKEDEHFSRSAEAAGEASHSRYLHLANDLMGKVLHADQPLKERRAIFRSYAADTAKGFGPRSYALQHLALLSEQAGQQERSSIFREVLPYAQEETPITATALVLLHRMNEAQPRLLDAASVDFNHLLQSALTSNQPATRLTAQSLTKQHP